MLIEVQSYIINVSFPKTLDALIRSEYNGEMDIESLVSGSKSLDSWTSPKWAKSGDIVFFMFSVNSILAIKHMKREIKMGCTGYGKNELIHLQDLLDRGERIYSKYGGSILGIGRVKGKPEYIDSSETIHEAYWQSRVYALVSDYSLLETPIKLDEFKGFINLSCGGTITPVYGSQFEQLKSLIKSKNNIPEYFDNSLAMPIPFMRIDDDTWIQVTSKYRMNFFYESQFRAYYVDYFLRQMGDRKTFYSECSCIKAKSKPSYVDNVIVFGGKYLPVEVKLSINAEQDIKGQVRKYCNLDALVLKRNTGIQAPVERIINDKVLILDIEGLYLFDYCLDTITEICKLESITCNEDINKIRSRLISRLSLADKRNT
jgi:hypothetical protein